MGHKFAVFWILCSALCGLLLLSSLAYCGIQVGCLSRQIPTCLFQDTHRHPSLTIALTAALTTSLTIPLTAALSTSLTISSKDLELLKAMQEKPFIAHRQLFRGAGALM